jgi:hypothetical protein
VAVIVDVPFARVVIAPVDAFTVATAVEVALADVSSAGRVQAPNRPRSAVNRIVVLGCRIVYL